MHPLVKLILSLGLIACLSSLRIQAQPPLSPQVLRVESGGWHTCAIHTDNTLHCWGDNSSNQISIPSDLGTVKTVSLGSWHTCAIKSNDTVRCWGRYMPGDYDPPVNLGKVKHISAGTNFTCAIRANDHVGCWGEDWFGKTNPPNLLGNVKQISAGDHHVCAVDAKDAVHCWGDNDSGQSDPPTDLGSVKYVTAGSNFSCAIQADDRVECWGDNSYGQLSVPDAWVVKQINADSRHSCAIKSDDSVECWGENDQGENVTPADLEAVKQISSGHGHICAVKSDDTLSCWGENEHGEALPPQPLISLSGNSLEAPEGEDISVQVNTLGYTWTNIVVQAEYTGLATYNGDYQATPVTALTPLHTSNWLYISTLDDTEIEGDETITVSIKSVTGGIEDGDQVLTIVIKDNDTITPTATMDDVTPDATLETPTSTPTSQADGINLIANSGFETTAGNEPELSPWKLKNASDDKIACDKTDRPGKPDKIVAHSGTCTFRFKSSVGEASELEQNVLLVGSTFNSADELHLSAYVHITSIGSTGKPNIRIKYDDGTKTDKLEIVFVPTSGYEELTGDYLLTSANVSKIKVQFQYTGTLGKVYIDDVQLIHTAGTPSQLLPLP